MESFNLIRNSLMDLIQSKSVEPKPHESYKNTLKTTPVAINPTSYFGSSSVIYGRRMEFEIPREYDNLAHMYIKCVLTAESVGQSETYLATKIMKLIKLKSKSGTTIQDIKPVYTTTRLDEIVGTPLYSRIITGVEPLDSFNTTETIFIPVFVSCSDDISSFFPTRDLEQLILQCEVNDSKEDMGMSQNLSSATFQLICKYHDVNTSNKISDLSYTDKPGLLKTLPNTYNAFYEDGTVCPAGTTSARILLTCPHPSFVLHMVLKNGSSQQKQIITARIETNGRIVEELDYRANYEIYSECSAFVDAGTFSRWANKINKRHFDSGLIPFNDHMFPTYVTITFESSDDDYTLYIFEEYRTSFSVSKEGRIRISTDDEYKGVLKIDASQNSQSNVGPIIN